MPSACTHAIVRACPVVGDSPLQIGVLNTAGVVKLWTLEPRLACMSSCCRLLNVRPRGHHTLPARLWLRRCEGDHPLLVFPAHPQCDTAASDA